MKIRLENKRIHTLAWEKFNWNNEFLRRQWSECKIRKMMVIEKSSIQSKSLSIKDWLNKILSYRGIVACLKYNGVELILVKNILAFSEFPDDFAISMYILLLNQKTRT